MASRRRLDMMGGSTDTVGGGGQGDNLFSQPQMNIGAVPRGGTAGPAPGGMPGTQGNPNTGVGGGEIPGPPQGPQLPTVPIVSPTENQPATLRSPNLGNTMGLDPNKFNDPNKHDFKYDTQRTLSAFDPRQGFTPEVLEALNGLGYGTFSSSGGDKLSLSGAKNAKDAADFSDQDWIFAKDANSDATKWNFGGGGAAPQGSNGSSGAPDMSGLLKALTGGSTPPTSSGRASSGAGPTEDPFTSIGGGVRLATGEWVPKDSALASGPKWEGGPDKLPEGPATIGAPKDIDKGMNAPGGDDEDDIHNILKKFLSGDLNNDIVNRRVDSARDTLNSQRSGARDTLMASLADRGQLGPGSGESAELRLDDMLNEDFGQQVNDIYANEGENADSRLAQALSTSANMSMAEAQNAIDRFRANTDRTKVGNDYDLGGRRLDLDRSLGEGDLDVRRRGVENQGRQIDNDYNLGSRRIDNDFTLGSRGLDLSDRGQRIDWDKFQATYGLDRERLQSDIENGNWDHILALLGLKGRGADTSAGGYVGDE